MKELLEKIYTKLISPVLKDISRPDDIPLIVPDCGWNHGETSDTPKKEQEPPLKGRPCSKESETGNHFFAFYP
jgi:hypothetical protein